MEDISKEQIDILKGKQKCDDFLFLEGKRTVKLSFEMWFLSLRRLTVGILFMISGLTSYIKSKFDKNAVEPGVVLCTTQYRLHGGIDIEHHFPLLKRKKKMMKIVNGSGEKPHRSNHRSNQTRRTYQDVMADKDAE